MVYFLLYLFIGTVVVYLIMGREWFHGYARPFFSIMFWPFILKVFLQVITETNKTKAKQKKDRYE